MGISRSNTGCLVPTFFTAIILGNFLHDTDAPPPVTVTTSPLTEPGKIRVSWTPPTPPTGSTILVHTHRYVL